MALLSLNHDVLCEILDQTDPQSALRLSMVSRKAHHLGVPQALSRVTLSRSQQQVSAFCHFVLSDPQRRLPYLRELVIESGAFGVTHRIEFQRAADFSATEELATLLEQAHRLRHLSIACFEDLIVKEPRIAAAVCALPGLVDVGLHNCGHLSTALLPRLRSRPRKLAFTALFNRKLPSFFHRLIALDRLESLEISYLDLSDGSQPHAEIHEIPHMPSLRSLAVRGSTARMSLFVRSMPNLQTLRIADVCSSVDESSDHYKGGSWPSLAHLQGNVPDFRHWKVACPVRWLQLDLTAYHYDDALDIIRRNSPLVLSLPVETKVGATFWGSFISAAPRLRHLEVCLDEGKSKQLETWMNVVPRIIGSLRISSVFLCVRYTHWIGSRMDQGIAAAENESTLRTLRERTMEAIPTLRYITTAVAFKGENPFEGHQALSWWQVTSVSGTRRLEVVGADRGEGLRDDFLHAHYDAQA
ncbi:uncharacterized protein FIBRA_03865 [Fibroporia radiculosa]|uniref:F-box domain-containing protein n=1 Tax=Fibroporia radiculosa TaxID=599839 RepID=J4G6G5_9APHY|nr:uncharacterized protein FIBRA_03865 [Fibroporia radiculosa]CCM01798.1 predicted protein [Fibroporia radiculosa]